MRTVLSVQKMSLMRDSQQVEHRRCQIAGLDAVAGWKATVLVTRSVNLPAADPSPGHREAEHLAPVITSAFRVDLRRAAKFADRQDKRFIEQAALIEILAQR